MCARKEHSYLLLGGSRLILNSVAKRQGKGEAMDGALLERPNICTNSFWGVQLLGGGSGDIHTRCVPALAQPLFPGTFLQGQPL